MSIERCQIVGVLNVTPDSFSDGGAYLRAEDALRHGEALISSGAEMIDIGAEATGPGSRPLTADEELRRLSPVLPLLAKRYPLSIDTYHATTARWAAECGVRMLNDISALRADPEMVAVARDTRLPIVLMFSKDGPMPHVTDQPGVAPDRAVEQVAQFLSARVDFALAAGVNESQLILDPGMGRFVSTDPDSSWRIIEALPALVKRFSPIPLYFGASRKGFLGGGTMEERDAVSHLVALHAALSGVRYVRTHVPGQLRRFLTVWSRVRSDEAR